MNIPIYRRNAIVAQAEVDDDYEGTPGEKWYLTPDGYVYHVVGGKREFLHRRVAGTPTGKYTDHKNGNRLDNRRTNLRICTTQENLQNRKKHVNNKGKYKGVTKHESSSGLIRYHATIQGEYLGTYESEEEAARAYDLEATKRFGEYSRPNNVSVEKEPKRVVGNRTTDNKYRGIAWIKEKEKWRSRIIEDGKYIFLGYFDSPEEAAEAYDIGARERGHPEKRMNFPKF